MSIFDAGFIMWGYFLVYALFIVGYFTWMVARDRKERRRQKTNSQQGARTP